MDRNLLNSKPKCLLLDKKFVSEDINPMKLCGNVKQMALFEDPFPQKKCIDLEMGNPKRVISVMGMTTIFFNV